MPGACRARIFVCIEVEMSDANVVCANVYIRIRTTRRRRRVNPGHAPMKGAIMHFSPGDDRGRARLKGPLTRAAASRLLPGRQSPPGHYRTHLAIYRCEARQVRAPPSPPRLPAPRSPRLTAFYGRVIRSVTECRGRGTLRGDEIRAWTWRKVPSKELQRGPGEKRPAEDR